MIRNLAHVAFASFLLGSAGVLVWAVTNGGIVVLP